MAPVLYSRDSVAVHYQSKGIPFQEWLGQITLCFAPYAAHVLIGVPQFISLQKGQQPRWTNKINFFNPTTIIWRYVSIFDRRIRAHTWTAENMAASNAAFFTARGWNGSEALMGLLGENWLIRTPSGTRITLLSVSAIGTIVVSFQGVQALYELIFQIRTGVPLIQGLGGIFLPLAVFGLLRVFPAMWLSDEFAYKSAAPESCEAQELEALIQIPRNRESNSYTESNKYTEIRLDILPIEAEQTVPTNKNIRQKDWKSIAWRTFIFILFILFIVMGVGHLLTNHATGNKFNLSILITHFVYQVMIAITLVLFVVYLFLGRADTTIIPCISSKWYTAYTLTWYTAIVAVIVINAIETRRTSCGIYTTYPSSAGLDAKMCAEFAGS